MRVAHTARITSRLCLMAYGARDVRSHVFTYTVFPMQDLYSQVIDSPLYARVGQFIRSAGLLRDIGHVDLALSGGADSVCMTLMLWAFVRQNAPEITLRAHHVRHHLREGDDVDAHISRDLAQRLDIPFIQSDLAWDALPDSDVESQAREARHACLAHALSGFERPALALAHHGDENLETALWRLGRGCGLDGLTLAPRRDMDGITRIRPMLAVGKADICQCLASLGIAWAEDPSNQSLKYRRNQIRHTVLPPLARSASSPECLYRSLLNVGNDACALSELADAVVKSCVVYAGAWFCPMLRWNELGKSAQIQVLRHAARIVCAGHCPDSAFVFRAQEMIASRRQNWRIIVDSCITVGWSRDGISIWRNDMNFENSPALKIDVPSSEVNVWNLCKISCFKMIPETALKNTTSTIYIDAEALCGELMIRPASEFSQLQTATGNLCKTREALRSQGVPDAWRQHWPILCSGNRPLWVFGGMRTLDAIPAQPGKSCLAVSVIWK